MARAERELRLWREVSLGEKSDIIRESCSMVVSPKKRWRSSSTRSGWNVRAVLERCGWGGLLLTAAPSLAQIGTTSDADASIANSVSSEQGDTTQGCPIRPFHVHVSDEALLDLRRRINATRWPDKETVADRSQGTQLAKLQELVRYWGTDYDWRKVEAKLNALPHFITTIDGLDIHFIHVRSRHPNALPVIITHGWPGSVTEQLKIIGPLTDPTAHGGRAQGRL
jgi:hypothetical protein